MTLAKCLCQHQVCREMKLRAQEGERFHVRDGWGSKLFLLNSFLGLPLLILNFLVGVPDLRPFSVCIPPGTGSSPHYRQTIAPTLPVNSGVASVCLSSFTSHYLYRYLNLSHPDLSLATPRFVQLSDGTFGAPPPNRVPSDGCPLVLVHVASFQRRLP